MKYPKRKKYKNGRNGLLGMIVDQIMVVVAWIHWAMCCGRNIKKVDSSCSVIMSVNNSPGMLGTWDLWNRRTKSKYLTKLSTGRWISSFCLSGPGSWQWCYQSTLLPLTWVTITCSAALKLDYNGGTSSVPSCPRNPILRHKGINAFIVQRPVGQGVNIGAKEDKLGIRGFRYPHHHVHRCKSAKRKPYWRRWLWFLGLTAMKV